MSAKNSPSPAATETRPDSAARRATGSAAHAEPIAVHPRATAEQAFIAVGVACLRQCTRNEAGVMAGSAEALHQLRVGLRRLRAALSLFKPLFAESELAGHRAELRWLTGELGLARDYDVFLSASPHGTRSDRASDGTGGFRAALVQRRQQAFEQARQAVASERARRLLRGMAVWFVSAGWEPAVGDPRAAFRAKPARAFAQGAFERRTKRIRKRARRLAALQPSERHALRVAVKKLRYGTEFFETLFEGSERRRQRFTRRLETLQESLGKLNDLTVQRRLAAELTGRAPSRPPTALDHDNRDSAPEAETEAGLLEAAARGAKRFAKTQPFWC